MRLGVAAASFLVGFRRKFPAWPAGLADVNDRMVSSVIAVPARLIRRVVVLWRTAGCSIFIVALPVEERLV